jgi:DNA-binding response OmpR family regulator
MLVVEDDPAMSAMLTRSLRREGYAVDPVGTGTDAVWGITETAYDVVVLDAMIPAPDGFEVCRQVRERGRWVPVLMLTARDAMTDKVRGLDAGADDYLTKPFAFKELLARVRALGRRRGAPLPETLRVADLEVDLGAHRVRRDGKSIELTAKEFALLEFFVLHHGQVVDRAAITAHVWDENHDPFTNVLEVLVRRLRRKIDDDFPTKLIQTVRGAGYRLGD